jgi:hypothetical protein
LIGTHPVPQLITITAQVTKGHGKSDEMNQKKRWQGMEQEGRKLGVEAK